MRSTPQGPAERSLLCTLCRRFLLASQLDRGVWGLSAAAATAAATTAAVGCGSSCSSLAARLVLIFFTKSSKHPHDAGPPGAALVLRLLADFAT
mmetsp:Transcript_2350/g.4294  ORF Transcript_2350/g.4294 Transcript_2350/m.4294 type:complete len:94 (-) Transcript_2350:1118-1399(-)